MYLLTIRYTHIINSIFGVKNYIFKFYSFDKICDQALYFIVNILNNNT